MLLTFVAESAARALLEKDPAYSYVTARLLLNTIRCEVLGEEASQAAMEKRYAVYFPQFIERGNTFNVDLTAESVKLVRAIDRQDRDLIAFFDGDCFVIRHKNVRQAVSLSF